MNKATLINYVAGDTGITKKDARIVINSVIEGISAGLASDAKVTLVGFGTFSVVDRKARKARNPKTGEVIEVPEKTVPKFKASAALKEAVADMDLGAIKAEKDAEKEADAETDADADAETDADADAE